MNRLTNVFTSSRLAKLHIAQAKEDIKSKNMERACMNLTHAIECVMSSINNVASIAFNAKAKK